MRYKPITVRRAVRLATSALDVARENGLRDSEAAELRTLDDLKGLARSQQAHIYYDQGLPAGILGLTLSLKGKVVITLSKDIATTRGGHARVLAHELGHCLLGHVRNPVLAVAKYSAATGFDREIQFLSREELEIEADLLGLMLIVPDVYLHSLADRGWISASRIVERTGLGIEQVAARIDLYRQIHGYERTMRHLREKLSDPICQVDLSKWRATELAAGTLSGYLAGSSSHLGACLLPGGPGGA
jgi:hypothetical protein